MLGQDHIQVAESMSLFRVIMLQLNSLEIADEVLHKAYSIQLQTLGHGHQEIASILANLGVLEKRRDNLIKSQDYHEQVQNLW